MHELLKPLEVRDEAARAALRLAVDTFGRLSVLVNNTVNRQFAKEVGPFLKMLRGLEGRLESDPRRIAHESLQLANSAEVPVSLTLGVDAERWVQHAVATRSAEAGKWRHLTVSTPFKDERFDSRLSMAKSGINS